MRDLLAAVRLQLGWSGGVMGVGVDDHQWLPPTCLRRLGLFAVERRALQLCYKNCRKQRYKEYGVMPDIPRLNGVIKALEQAIPPLFNFPPTSKVRSHGRSTFLAFAKLCSSCSTGADRRTNVSSHGSRVRLSNS